MYANVTQIVKRKNYQMWHFLYKRFERISKHSELEIYISYLQNVSFTVELRGGTKFKWEVK